MQAANYGAMSKSVTLSRVLPSEPRTVGHPKMLAEHTFRGVLTVESRAPALTRPRLASTAFRSLPKTCSWFRERITMHRGLGPTPLQPGNQKLKPCPSD